MTPPIILPPIPIDPARHPGAGPVRDRQAHLDAQRIGTRPPAAPHVFANLLATDALFCSFDRRRPVWERHA